MSRHQAHTRGEVGGDDRDTAASQTPAVTGGEEIGKYRTFRQQHFDILMPKSQMGCDASAMGKIQQISSKSCDTSHDFTLIGGALRPPAAYRRNFRHRQTRRGPLHRT